MELREIGGQPHDIENEVARNLTKSESARKVETAVTLTMGMGGLVSNSGGYIFSQIGLGADFTERALSRRASFAGAVEGFYMDFSADGQMHRGGGGRGFFGTAINLGSTTGRHFDSMNDHIGVVVLPTTNTELTLQGYAEGGVSYFARYEDLGDEPVLGIPLHLSAPQTGAEPGDTHSFFGGGAAVGVRHTQFIGRKERGPMLRIGAHLDLGVRGMLDSIIFFDPKLTVNLGFAF